MKSTCTKIKLVFLFALGMLLLSACTANFITDIKSDGSGTFTQEYGFTEDEIVSYGMTVDENLCTTLTEGSEMLPGTTTSREQRGDEIYCIFATPFATLDELNTIYTSMSATITDLRIENGIAYYNVTLDLGEESSLTGPYLAYWIVKMPGSITTHNATEQNGNSLTWDMASSGTLNASATSNTGGVSSTVWWIAGIAALCLCFVVLVAVVVLIIVLVRRNKQKAAVPDSTAPQG